MHTQKKSIRMDFVVMSLAIALALLLCTFCYIWHVRSSLHQEAKNYLQEVSGQSAKALNIQIRSDLKYLQSLADSIGEHKTINITDSVELLKKKAAKSSFKRLVILFPNGTASSTDGMGGDFTDEPYFIQSMGGNSCVLEPMEDRRGYMVNTYSVPIYHDGIIIGVLMANISTDVFQKLIAVNSFEGQTSSFVLNSSGDTLMSAAGNSNISKSDNYAPLFVTGSAFYNSSPGQQILNDFSLGHRGAIDYRKDGEKLFISYAPIGINDWYLLTSIPSSVASAHLNEILLQTILMCFCSILLVIALFLYIIYSGKQKKNQLMRAAYCDPITKGHNWNRFQLDANRFLDRHGTKKQAVIMLNVNKFKVINDSYGHVVGDKILCAIDTAMKSVLTNEQPFGRYFGDQFAFVTEYDSPQEINDLIDRLTDAVRLNCKEASKKVTCSFGIYQICDYSISLRTMVDRAIIAFQTIKNRHETTTALFDNSMLTEIMKNKHIEDHMEDALKNHEFIVYLQPKFHLKNNRVESAEALTRWKNPELGLVFPGSFIPLFENNGFIIKLDYYILEEVCCRIRRWMNLGIQPYPIAVNISRIHLTQTDFVETVCSILRKYDVPTNMIELELTESAIFDNMEIVPDLLKRLHALGFILSMDDFGNGYSSLHTLKDLTIDTLKIDRGFFVVNNPEGRLRSRIVVRNVISMAKELHITTVAEGIEEKEQADYLKEIGCDIIQGYYFGKPVPMDEFEEQNFNVHLTQNK